MMLSYDSLETGTGSSNSLRSANESLRTDVQLIEMMTAESNRKRWRRDHQRPGQPVSEANWLSFLFDPLPRHENVASWLNFGRTTSGAPCTLRGQFRGAIS
jgi:hypothetical protein